VGEVLLIENHGEPMAMGAIGLDLTTMGAIVISGITGGIMAMGDRTTTATGEVATGVKTIVTEVMVLPINMEGEGVAFEVIRGAEVMKVIDSDNRWTLQNFSFIQQSTIWYVNRY
jgi:NAD(P)H-hydrate repair Nnr-like enzyme with NAD(P)H-hydrate dehydratase domain